MPSAIHNVRSSFILDDFLKARKLTIDAVTKVASEVFVGMTEKDGDQIIDKVLKEMGHEKKWHPNKFRIGENTVKSFRDKSVEGVTLKEDDIFFIDVGPVWDNYEGDYGDTFVIGHNEEFHKIKEACKVVFNKTKEVWQKESLSGVKLYNFAQNCAESLGYKLNNRMKGHRIGDFPHHVFYRGGMLETEEVPCDNLWVLEIHLISNTHKYGSFFEDILKK